MEEQVILVDTKDNQIGVKGKQAAHQSGDLHRAISIFLFNSKGEMLLQKRASTKYHSGGLWTNTCCTHPRDGETTTASAHRRLQEEMGMTSELEYRFSFIYKAHLANGLIEHEFDHVFFGETDATPQLNPEEAEDFKYENIYSIIEDIKQNGNKYTEWFKVCLEQVKNHLELKQTA